MFDEEEWRVIEDFPHYLVSSHGNVRHIDRINPRSIRVSPDGFPVIALLCNPSPLRYLRHVNKLVATAFLPPPQSPDENTVWHKDGNLRNCRADNLMWEMRSRVLEWNDMHRRGKPRYDTPRVQNNRTGMIYANAFECAMHENMLESQVIYKIEVQNDSFFDPNERYCYV